MQTGLCAVHQPICQNLHNGLYLPLNIALVAAEELNWSDGTVGHWYCWELEQFIYIYVYLTHHMNILADISADMKAAVKVALAVYHQNSSFQKLEMGYGRVLI